MKKYFTAIVILGAQMSMFSQTSEKNIDEISLQGKILNVFYKNTNENVIIISPEDLRVSPAKSIDELLQQFAGIDIRRRGANGVQSDISIRGGSFEQTLILINGVRMNDAQTGHNSLHIPVDLSNIERIELLKGPAARRFGNGAFSGAINIVTKTSSNENVKFSAEGGDYSSYKLGISSNFGNNKISNLIQANSDSSEGYRYNTDYKIANVYYQNQVNLGKNQFHFQAGFSEKKFGANGFYATPSAVEQYEEVQSSVVSVKLFQNFKNFKMNSGLFWRRGQDLYLFNRQKPEIYRNMHIGNNFGAEINGRYDSKIGVTGIGAEVRKEMLSSNNLGNRERLITQLFMEHYFSFFQNKLKISPGISWENYSGSANYFYPGLDVGYQFNDKHKIYANIAKVNRIPTFTDLYYVSKTEIGNENLKPESALSYEIGYRFNKNGWSVNASTFGRNTNNGIDWVKATTAEKWRAENIGKISTKGFDAEFKQDFRCFIKSYSIGYTFIKNTFEQNTVFSKYILDNLKHHVVAKLENQIIKGFTNQLIYRYQERANNYSYHILDERINYTVGKTEFYILINNLTNTRYSEAFGVPMPGRWFHVGFNVKINM